jgi:hypothetical protein
MFSFEYSLRFKTDPATGPLILLEKSPKINGFSDWISLILICFETKTFSVGGVEHF